MIQRVSTMRRRPDESAFTLIELLVVIIILGLLAAVVVFAVRGVGDKGQASAYATDAKTLRTAEEAFCGKNGFYASSQQQLADAKLLSEPGTLNNIQTAGVTGPCGNGTQGPSGYLITCDATKPGCGAGGTQPVGGVIKVAGTNVVANVTGNNFVNPAVSSSGTLHPNVEYMFNGLMRWAPDNTPQPDLAQTFNISADQKTATFTLRPGMTWHNGTPILNTDVKFTFEKALLKYHSRTGPSMVPALGGTGGGTTSLTLPAGAITTSGTDGVTFNFVRPYPPLLRQMNVTEAPIIPQNVYGPCDDTGSNNINTSACPPNNPPDNADFPADTATRKKPVGSGPFMFKRRDTTTAALTFAKFTNYHLAGLPYANELDQVPSADVGNSLKAGSVDVGSPAGNRVPPVPAGATFTPDITPANGFTLDQVPRGTGGGNCITTLAFHLWAYGTTTNSIGSLPPDADYTNPFFGDPTLVDPDGAGPVAPMPRGTVVRRAISMGIDRAALFNAIDFGKGRVPDSPYHSGLTGAYVAQPSSAASGMPPFDTATAAAWLDAAGWTVQGGIRKSTGAAGMPAAGTPLAWATRRTTGSQDSFYQGMKQQLAQAPVSINVAAGTGNAAEPPADSSTQVTGALVAGARNYDMLSVSFCNGDDPVIGVRRQYHSDGMPASGSPANFTNPSGYRRTAMDTLWDNAYGANYATNHAQIQTMAANDAPMLWFDETLTTRAWRTGCSGFNNQNTGLFVETASCTAR